ncbi:DNA repair protein RecN [Flavimarina sp. Hel_I_48]|uniref:DNA repair protein RecN n=1 Tax=Flavimarina sp. Hel_I_48 TaxID=1392488 RepID=UPI0004DED20A|nr:DNA repair protein RecN [Flavimarina sp. Hel_I_48]
MLTNLHIKNYALIEEVNLAFDSGFTVITGETGAGKSILLGALGLILGKRADLSSIGDPENKCVIEAQFQVGSYDLETLFKSEDLDYENQTIVRREILPSGKSRAFVNDTPVTLSQLSALGERLVDIHSQHQTLELTDNDFQFQVLDAFSGNEKPLEAYKIAYKSLKKEEQELKKLKAQQAKALREEEYKNFLLDELLEANLKAGEQEKLEARYETLNNVEQITDGLAEAHQTLTRDELGVLDQLTAIKVRVSKLAGFSKELADLNERLESVGIELDDIAESVDMIAQNTEGDPEELGNLEARLKLFFDLQKKHGAGSIEEVIVIRDALDEEVQSMNDLGGKISKLEKNIAAAKEQLNTMASKLSEKRASKIEPLTKKLEAILSQLGMPNARFEMRLIPVEEFRDNGKEDLEFLFTANKGMRAQELKKAASGGELSRIMLAIKSVLSDFTQLSTLIFDEIDTGVSGEVALKMGQIMKAMGKRMQLVSITHLPQIASQGAHHFKVFKKDKEERTTTGIEQLSTAMRIDELAEMLGGKATSEAARDHAKQLLEQGR